MLCWSVLLLAVLQLTAAAQDNEEQQEAVTRGPCVSEGYGPPQDVTVTPVGYTALNVSWQPPHVQPPTYEIKISRKVKLTNSTFGLIEGLSYCTDYLILVISIYEDELCYNSTNGKTDTPPPEQPDYCNAFVSTMDSTTVKVNYWGGGGHCHQDVSYNISWKWVVLWNEGEGSYTGETLYNVHPYSNVTATVSVTSATGTPPSCWVLTPQAKSSAPTYMSIYQTPDNSKRISWSLPTRMNGVLTGWLLNWRDPDGLLNGQVQLEANYSHYTIEDMDSSRHYVKIMAINGDGFGYPGRLSAGFGRNEHSTDVSLILTLVVCGILIAVLVFKFVLYVCKKISQPRATSRTQVPVLSYRELQGPSTNQEQEPSTRQVQEPSTRQ